METNNYDKKSDDNFDPSYFESKEFKERQRRMNEEFDRTFKEKDEMEHKKIWLFYGLQSLLFLVLLESF